MKKLALCVIFGGKTDEYYVSLRSAYSVLSNISYEKYDVIRIGITKSGEWYLFEGENSEILNDTWHCGAVCPVALDMTNGYVVALDKHTYALGVDLFFPLSHGEYVEDGRLQGLFDVLGVKYVGSGAFASHLCMDKALTKAASKKAGIGVARWQEMDSQQRGNFEKADDFAYPVFVKPCMGGSSVGVSRVKTEGELYRAVLKAGQACQRVLIEEEIVGSEVEVAVLETGGELLISPAGMIKYKGEFYGYEEKYNSADNQYIIPAPLDEETAKYLGECAKKLFLELGCRGLARFDFFITDKGEAVFNEVNTMPGFTEASMFPKLFGAMGYSYSELLDIIIENAMYR